MSAKILKQLGIILAICLAAEFIVSLLPIAFPSSVMAILVLALLLFTKILKEEHIRETGDSVSYTHLCQKAGVKIVMNQEADLDLVKAEKPDAVVVSTLSLIHI